MKHFYINFSNNSKYPNNKLHAYNHLQYTMIYRDRLRNLNQINNLIFVTFIIGF